MKESTLAIAAYKNKLVVNFTSTSRCSSESSFATASSPSISWLLLGNPPLDTLLPPFDSEMKAPTNTPPVPDSAAAPHLACRPPDPHTA